MSDSVQRPPAPATQRQLALLIAQEQNCKIAAELTGSSHEQVRQWVSRENRKREQLAEKANVTLVTPAQPISETRQRIRDRLASNEKQTRLSLSRAHRLHAARAARGKLSPKETLQTAQGAAITHGWRSKEQTDQAQVAVNIAILSV